MNTPKNNPPATIKLFERIVTILEGAKTNVIHTVNSQMTIAYWLVGRELVQTIQQGDERAAYGKEIINQLSTQLNQKFGKGFSATNLWYFRQFYQVFADRRPKIRPISGPQQPSEILHKPCGESESNESNIIPHTPCGVLDSLDVAVEKSDTIKGFSPALSWSHYRTLAKVKHKNERLFYEIEAEKERWSVPVLERQIHSLLFARLLKSRDKEAVMELSTEGQVIRKPADAIKDPYVLDFLGLPDAGAYHETDLESAIITNLQHFLLELGKGFAFVARQKRLQYEDEFFYADLVFYNCILKCYLIIDLKIGKMTYQDIGQIDSYEGIMRSARRWF
jgi:predicted nuclease of restriction endonuclease-like (RecB) superfamily